MEFRDACEKSILDPSLYDREPLVTSVAVKKSSLTSSVQPVDQSMIGKDSVTSDYFYTQLGLIGACGGVTCPPACF